MVEVVHISIDDPLSCWKYSCSHADGCSVGRITSWGGHYICTIHDDVPEDERKVIAEFIANAPTRINDLRKENKKLTDRYDLYEKAMKKDKDEISRLKRKVNKLNQKAGRKKNEK